MTFLTRCLIRCLAIVLLLAGVSAAEAHPHVWVTFRAQILYAPDGSVVGVHHAWTFDDMFSTFAVQGLELKSKSDPTREELAPLAQTNVESLKEFEYFTFAKADGNKQHFVDPSNGAYWLDFKDSQLTLHFDLMLKQPVKSKDLLVEVFDPSYFVDFSFADKNSVSLKDAPSGCTFTAAKPEDENAAAQAKRLAQLPVDAPTDGTNYGMLFANRINVTCP